MDKKTYMLKLLSALEDSWPLAKGLKILIEGNTLDDNTMDGLLNIFKSAVKTVAGGIKQEKLQKSIDVMEKIKSIEAAEKAQDAHELAELDSMLADV